MIVGANCVRPLMIDTENVGFYIKSYKIETFSGEHSSPLRCGTMIFANEKLAIRDDTATGEDTASPYRCKP